MTVLGAGSFFGEMALLSSAGRSVASIAATQDCVTYRLSKRAYEDTVATYPSFKLYLESVAKLRVASMNKDDRLSKRASTGGTEHFEAARKASALDMLGSSTKNNPLARFGNRMAVRMADVASKVKKQG